MVRPSVTVRLDEVTELEYEGFTYKYDPFENKYTCGVCNAKSGERKRMTRHIKDKHIGKSAIHVLLLLLLYSSLIVSLSFSCRPAKIHL